MKIHPFEVTHRGVLAIAVPMTLAYLSTPLLGVVDTAVIGRLGEAHLIGAVAVGAMIFDVIFTTFNFLRSGTTGLTAQALGADDETAETAALYRAGLIAIGSSILLLLLQGPLLDVALKVIGASAAVEQETRHYFHVRMLGTPFALTNYVILGWFLGLGRARTGLLLQVLLNGLNIALDSWFVLGLGWGVTGIAAGTVISEATTTLVGALLAARLLGPRLRVAWAVIAERAGLLRTFGLNRDIMIRSFSLLAAFTLFTAGGARQGDIVLAANAILMNFFFAGSYFLDGFATAAEQLAGRALGARYEPAFRRAVSLTSVWGFGLAGLMSLVLLTGGPTFIDLLTTAPDVREIAGRYLVWAAFTPVFGVLAFEFDGVYIGATWSGDMRNMMLLSLAVFVVAAWAAVPALGNDGLWLALTLFLLVRGVTLAARYPVRLRRAFEG